MATKKNTTDEVLDTEVVDVKTKPSEVDLLKIIAEMQKKIETLESGKPTETKVTITSDSVVKGERVLSKEMKDEISRQEEKVLYLPLYDGDRYKDDIFVSVNDKNIVINRKLAYEKGGVLIPRWAYNIIKESEKNVIRLNSLKSIKCFKIIIA